MRFFYALVLLVLLALTSICAQTPGMITGRVVSDSGQPLANAKIMLRPSGLLQTSASTITDRDGKFQMSGLEPRPYQLTVWLSAYTPFTPSTNYRVGDSVRVVLTKGGVITGTVTKQTGEPVVGVRVRARMIDAESNLLSPGFFAPEQATDDRGVYRIYGLRTGTYVVWAGGGGGRGVDSGIDPFDDFVPTYSPGSTRDSAAEINVRAGEEVSNVDIRFRGEPGHVISGRAIQSKSAQSSNFLLNLTAIGKGRSDWNMITVQPDDSRRFVFRGVDNGEYDLTALPMVADGPGSEVASKRIKVNGADVTGIELVTEPLASVSGRVVLEEANKTECSGKQRPLFSETLVSAAQDESQPSDYQFPLLLKAPAGADANGNVSLKNLPPGRYFFVPEFAAKYWYLQSITLPPPPGAKPVDATRNWTTLKSGDRLSGLTITLAQGAASLSGQVVDNRADNLLLYLVPAEKERAEDVLRFFGAAVGPDGKVALTNLPPGRYWSLVKSNTEVLTDKLRMPDQKELRASLRREAEAAKSAIDLKPCQHLTDFKLNQ
jgi:hypothetical protein